MKILMVGAGATGGYYGTRLALAGRDVTFLVRGRRAEQLRRDGIRIEGPSGNATLPSPKIITAAELNTPFDVIILSTKAYSLEGAMNDIAPAVGENTIILPILNGMKHLDTLAERFGKHRILGGSVRIVCDMNEDGTIHQMTPLDHLTFGELPPHVTPTSETVILSETQRSEVESKDLLSSVPSTTPTETTISIAPPSKPVILSETQRSEVESKDLHSSQPSTTHKEATLYIPAENHVQSTSSTARSAALRDLLTVPGITLTLSENIIAAMWQKWWILSTMGAVCVLGGGTVGDVIATGEYGIAMAKAVQQEAIAIAAANGYPADPAFAAAHEQRMTEPGSTLTSSMYRDMTKGLPVEADHILGDLLARANGTAAPLLAAAYTHLKVYEGQRA